MDLGALHLRPKSKDLVVYSLHVRKQVAVTDISMEFNSNVCETKETSKNVVLDTLNGLWYYKKRKLEFLFAKDETKRTHINFGTSELSIVFNKDYCYRP